MLNSKALAASVSAGPAVYVEDVFSTFLYTGTGATQTITNGIDLSGKGGLTWIKGRSGATGHRFTDTSRGATKSLASNSNAAEATESTGLTSFSSTGFTIGADADYNTSAAPYCSWTFRKQPKFFDVVTYTGNGTARTIAHNLGSVPGCIIAKILTGGAADWFVYHRSFTGNQVLQLNTTDGLQSIGGVWDSTANTSSVFGVGSNANVNGSGNTYVAYLFAHDAGGFGDSGSDNVISCGSYIGTGTEGSPEVNIGWEPQWLLIKNASSASEWVLVDSIRGLPVGNDSTILYANTSGDEAASRVAAVTATGFKLGQNTLDTNTSGNTYVFVAIRRGPMKTPDNATKVFQAKVYTGTNVDNRLVTTDIVTDTVWVRQRNDTALGGMVVGDRLRGQPYLLTGTTAAEVSDADSFDREIVSGTERGTAFSSMTGFWVGNDATSKLNANTTSNNHVVEAFRRARGFFDVVAYTGTGANRTVSHNLGVVPELIIVKKRSAADNWVVYAGDVTDYLILNTTAATADLDTMWNDTAPTSAVFSLGTNDDVNGNTATFIAYLFATLPGVSKVGSYTGTGTTKQIDCGFTAGARFVLIKRTDSTGDWYVWDTTRGIISGNDPYLLINSTAAEVTGTDYIDPLSSGFEISSTAPAAINANGGSFIFLAIA